METGLFNNTSDVLDKKNVTTFPKKPSFFEKFKAQCSESDLGPISINWFEELSSEAPLYNSKRSEEPENKTNDLDQSNFKTPQRKLPAKNQFASTPMIFNESNKSVPFISPIKELGQCKAEAVLNGSFMHTPKIFEVQTPKCIFESLGAEADPEMTWSSSLATPPTLSPTVIIARGNDSVSGTKRHNERIEMVMHSLISKYGRSPKTDSMHVQSTSGIEDVCAETDSKIQNFERLLDGSFDKNIFPSKLGEDYTLPNVPVDEDMDDGMENVCLASRKAFLRKPKRVKESKTYSDKMKREYQEIDADKIITKYGNSAKCYLKTIANNEMQEHSVNQKSLQKEEEMPALLCAWSQLDLSGLDMTQLEKTSPHCSDSSPVSQIKKSSEDRQPSVGKECASIEMPESCVQNTSCLINCNKLLNISSLELIPPPENSSLPVAISSNKSPTLVKDCEAELAPNVSDSSSFITENTTLSEADNSCCNYSRKNCKKHCEPLGSVSTQAAGGVSGLTRSGLKSLTSLSGLKKRPKKFIYTVNNTPVHQEEGTTKRERSSACLVPICADLNSYDSEISTTAIRNEEQKEDIMQANKHVPEEKEQMEFDRNCILSNVSYEAPLNYTECNFTNQLPILQQTDSRKGTIMPSSNISGIQETESNESMSHLIGHKINLQRENGERGVSLTCFSSLQEAAMEESTSGMHASKTGSKQAILESATQKFLASSPQVAELGSQLKETPKPTIDDFLKLTALEKKLDGSQHLQAGLAGNAEASEQSWLGGIGHSKTEKFVGFRTASNKQIALSDCNIRKGKLLFKDIEDKFIEDFPSKEIQNISNENTQRNAEIASLGRSKLTEKSSNFSHVSDPLGSQMNDVQIIFPKCGHSAFQNVLSNQKGKLNLTASQEAEVTEISNILEETGSQFEFTQFKKHKTVMFSNADEMSGSFDKNDICAEVLKETDFEKSSEEKVQRDHDVSHNKHISTAEKSKIHSGEEATPINSSTKQSNTFVPIISAPSQFSLSDLGSCSAGGGKEMSFYVDAVKKATKFVSNLDGVNEMLSPHKKILLRNFSNRCNNSWSNPNCMKETEIDWHQRVKEVNAEYLMKNNTKDTIKFVKENIESKSKIVNYNEGSVQISSTTEVNLKIIKKYSFRMTGNELSAFENNQSVLVSHHIVNCEETRCNYNLQEALSDLTCLAEVAKTEKRSILNNAYGKENCNLNQEEEKAGNLQSGGFLQRFHFVTDGDISAGKREKLHLLAASCAREEPETVTSSTGKTSCESKKEVSSEKENTNLSETERYNHQELSEIRKEKQIIAMGFHTASGKQITITNESLAKAKHLLSEDETVFVEKKEEISNFVKPIIQEKKKEKITKVSKEFEEGNEKHEYQYPEGNFEELPDLSSNTVKKTEDVHTIKELTSEMNAAESDLISHTRGGEMNEGLLTKNNVAFTRDKNISKLEFIDSAIDQHLPVEESDTSEMQGFQDLSSRNTSNNKSLNSSNLICSATAQASTSGLKNEHSLLNHIPDECHKKNYASENLTCISQEASPSKKLFAENNVHTYDGTCKNESSLIQKCDLRLFSTNALQKYPASEASTSTSKHLKAKPLAFNTASGKAVGVSQEALKKVRQVLHEDCYKSVKENMESQLKTNKHELLDSHSDTCDTGVCIDSNNYSSAENIPVENIIATPFSQTKECCADEQTLQYTGSMTLSTHSELCFQMNDKHSDARTSSKQKCIKSDFPNNNSGCFSTASGKPVHLSEESLKKARLLFSEMENNSSDQPSHVSNCVYSYDEASSAGNKETPRQDRKLVSQGKRLSNTQANSNIPCGFATASGKQVQISQKALQSVMGLLKEFDDVSGNSFSIAQQSVGQGHISPIKVFATEAVEQDEVISESKPRKKYTTSTPNENMIIKNPLHIMSHNKKQQQTAELEKSFTCSKEIEALKTAQPCQSRSETKCATNCGPATEGNIGCHYYSQTPENYLEIEATESAKAFMEDDKLADAEVQKNKNSILSLGKPNNFVSYTRTGKRHMKEENTSSGEPPIKRKLLPEFERSEERNKASLKPSKSYPDGIMNDRKKFTYNIPLKPVVCGPLSKTLTEEGKKAENTAKKPAKIFVPPFKTKANASEDKLSSSKESVYMDNKNINRAEEFHLTKVNQSTTETEGTIFEDNNSMQISALNSEPRDTNSDLTKIANLQYARSLQEIRIIKKRSQRICPQPGSLYLVKTSAPCKVPLKAAVGEKLPGSFTSDQLYALGTSKQCLKISSRNAEDFQFAIQDFFSRDYFLEERGIQLADGGYLIPTDEGKAGKEEFYRALCDTPGVDPKLISKAWVYNHFKWIVWKLAAMEVAFPQEFANKCLTPERLLLQLKYRYDVEVDQSHRSAIKRIVERDDVAAKTLILCISKIISLNTNMTQIGGDKSTVEDSKKDLAVVEVTDGWYGIKAVLDPPLQSLLCRKRLTVGQKIVVHGAELVGSQEASCPLEAPESLMLKISANSTRRARWYAKLGYHRDPRPFSLSLSSLLIDGGTVGCIDVIVQRLYPMQWMEKTAGSYVFRNCRAEEREAAKHAENRQKTLEALLAKIQAEFEKNEDGCKRVLRSRTLTRQQIRSLQDGAELYEAVLNAADPAYLESYFSEEQLKALNSHRQMVNDKRQAQIEAEYRKAVDSAEEENSSCRRHVTTVLKLRIVDYSKEEKGKEVILNIWRPSSDVCTLLREGARYRVFHLSASQSKGKLESVNIQLTATKKTQYLQLPVSQEILSYVYKPRECLRFSMLLEPSFHPTCSEVDLVGYIVCLRKGTGFSTLVYLSDENHHFIAVQIYTDLKQLAIDDIIIPSMLISAINLQWRREFRSHIPTLFAGDFSVFSSNPKESHLQGFFNELRNTVENSTCFGKDAQCKLMNLLQTDPQTFNLPIECGLDPISQKSDAGNKHSIAAPSSGLWHQSPLSPGKLDSKPPVSLGSAKTTAELETPKNCKKRRAMELLRQVPSPPPVKTNYVFISPSLKRAFQPPRSSGTQFEKSLKRTRHNKKPALRGLSETGSPLGNNFVADEELAMINTQALLSSCPEDTG